MEFPSILVARQRTSHVVSLLSISLLQNIAYTLFDTIGEIKDDEVDVKLDEKGKVDKYKKNYETEGRQILIIYGTEYGCSEEIAKLLFNKILELNNNDSGNAFQPRVVNPRDYHLIDFSEEQVCFIVISTSGDGVPPSDARQFYVSMLERRDLELSHLEYSLLALGDSNYPQFCKTGRLLDSRLLEMHCKCVVDRHDVDMEDWSVINKWLNSVLGYISTAYIEQKMDYLRLSDITEDKHNRHQPFMATLKIKRQITRCSSDDDKEVIHCEFDITDSDLTWKSGDALGIYPTNHPAEVSMLLKAMHCTGEEQIEKPSWAYTCTEDKNIHGNNQMDLRTVVAKFYDLKTVRADLFCMLKENTNDQDSSRLYTILQEGVFTDSSSLQRYLNGREVVDVLLDFPSHSLSWRKILLLMKSLQPRYYSISSSPITNNTRVCVTAAVLRYISHNRKRVGVTTTYLQDRLKEGETCPVFMSCNHAFRLPIESQSPIILVGPGTGIAPFRAFIQERALDTNRGETVLYFGCRYKDKDYLYRDELEKWSQDGVITLRVAFSREQSQKIYVQDLLLEDKSYIWNLIKEKQAYIYICGDAKYMAHDVHKALLTTAQLEGGLNETESMTFFKYLEQESRYQKDVWVV